MQSLRRNGANCIVFALKGAGAFRSGAQFRSQAARNRLIWLANLLVVIDLSDNW